MSPATVLVNCLLRVPCGSHDDQFMNSSASKLPNDLTFSGVAPSASEDHVRCNGWLCRSTQYDAHSV